MLVNVFSCEKFTQFNIDYIYCNIIAVNIKFVIYNRNIKCKKSFIKSPFVSLKYIIFHNQIL